MPSTRQKRTRNTRLKITPEAIRAYRAGDWLGLHRALSLQPWHISPLDTDGEHPPHNATLADALELRRDLECFSNGG